MSGLILTAVLSVIIIKIVFILDKRARRDYIPWEEIMQKCAQPDKYKPWSHEKRMRYYDHEQSKKRAYIPSRNTYVSYIETGYIQRRS